MWTSEQPAVGSSDWLGFCLRLHFASAFGPPPGASVCLLKATTDRNANTPPLHVLDRPSEDRCNPGSHAHCNHRDMLAKTPVSTVAKSKHELGRRHHSDDRYPIRPPHGWDAPDADLVPIFDERVDRRRKPTLVPGVFHV